ncbi:MAG: hypothetical protein EA361_05455 [Bacteroidetes bacterium]|nr:MAG: hypothetical protein EA361_05455 [Bacteroidota bacterium]
MQQVVMNQTEGKQEHKYMKKSHCNEHKVIFSVKTTLENRFKGYPKKPSEPWINHKIKLIL